MKTVFWSLVCSLFVISGYAFGEEGPGQVRISLEEYQRLVQHVEKAPRPAPAGAALGQATVKVTATEDDGTVTAAIVVDLVIEVLEDEWVSVPILPPGSPVRRVLVDGQPVQLTPTTSGLAWATQAKGTHRMHLEYQVDAIRSEAGVTLSVPIPAAAATSLTATLPGAGLEVAVIPAAGLRTRNQASQTVVQATIPAATGVQISWRDVDGRGPIISRATYEGALEDDADAIMWIGTFEIDLFSDRVVTLPLLASSVTLSDFQIDGKTAPIMVADGRFAARLEGRGKHQVVAHFQVPIVESSGPPNVRLQIPQIPVSRFDLTLPGTKDLTITPKSNVARSEGEGRTKATAYVSMTDEVVLTWTEAVPQDVEEEVRANAELYHSMHADEGVLQARVLVRYEITRGKTSTLSLEVPADVQVNRVTSPAGVIADWRIEGATLTVFLNRTLEENVSIVVEYDRSLRTRDDELEQVPAPLFTAHGVHRQRGMLALLATKEFTLEPVEEHGVTRVGENQLPSFVRQTLAMKVAHTFKYIEAGSRLVMRAAPPKRQQGKFDVQVDTLVSIADVTMKGSVTIAVNVKSGTLSALQITLPANVNVLGLTAPARRTHTVIPAGDEQKVDLEFTQEMEGQFRVDLTYEYIMADGDAATRVPTVQVLGAEVQQGRIAVEALSALEVQPAAAVQLTPLDPGELPRQLILKTTNPILLAYKYVHVAPPYELSLEVTRHRAIDVQSATIDLAAYRTLITTDGLAVTHAQFTVRNSRQQFLRVRLPKDSRVWSAFVNGVAEKPALATGDEEGDGDASVLIKIINSAEGFPVTLIYATPIPKLTILGTVSAELPRPDMIVTNTRWDVFFPHTFDYGRVDTNMTIVREGTAVTRHSLNEQLGMLHQGDGQVVAPLRLDVPAAGVGYSFQKLYANQSQEVATFSIPYASGEARTVGWVASVVATILVWGAVFLTIRPQPNVPSAVVKAAGIVGAVILSVLIGYFGMDTTPPLVASAILAVVLLGPIALRQRRERSAP